MGVRRGRGIETEAEAMENLLSIEKCFESGHGMMRMFMTSA